MEITDRAYTKLDVLDMEAEIVNFLNFEITIPSSLKLLGKLHRVMMADQIIYFLSCYILELALVDYKFVKY